MNCKDGDNPRKKCLVENSTKITSLKSFLKPTDGWTNLNCFRITGIQWTQFACIGTITTRRIYPLLFFPAPVTIYFDWIIYVHNTTTNRRIQPVPSSWKCSCNKIFKSFLFLLEMRLLEWIYSCRLHKGIMIALFVAVFIFSRRFFPVNCCGFIYLRKS